MSDFENSKGDKANKRKNFCCCPCFPKTPRRRHRSNMNGVNEAPQEKVPFKYDLQKEKPIGTSIRIKGRTLPNCSRFAINFVCYDSKSNIVPEESDIALHFNPRLQQRCVVRNCRINGRWGEEEISSIGSYKLDINQEFDIQCLISTSNIFLIAIDNTHFCSYKIKFPLEQITKIIVNGEVDVSGIVTEKVAIYPDPVATKSKLLTVPKKEEFVKTELSSPVVFWLPEGFQPNWQLEIFGKVKILPHSFFINLQEGSQYWPHPIIPLHLNPRFLGGHHLFIRNAWVNGAWGQEERTSNFFLFPGSKFTLSLRRCDNHFSVWINHKLIGEFKFRSNINKIDTLHIEGDVIVYGVYIDENP